MTVTTPTTPLGDNSNLVLSSIQNNSTRAQKQSGNYSNLVESSIQNDDTIKEQSQSGDDSNLVESSTEFSENDGTIIRGQQQ
mgnify:CR=1 FL=1